MVTIGEKFPQAFVAYRSDQLVSSKMMTV
jgi:hypothetical protein